MTAHTERRRVPYSVEQMYNMVAAIDRYPEFIPWIANARIRDRRNREEGGAEVYADLIVSFRVFRERYTSRVDLPATESSGAREINVEAVSGPFDKLVSNYRFLPAGPDASDFEFSVDFSFKNRALQVVAGAAFDLALRRIVGAFEARAAELYGETAA